MGDHAPLPRPGRRSRGQLSGLFVRPVVALMLAAFLDTFLATRLITHLIHTGRGPFRDTSVGGVHADGPTSPKALRLETAAPPPATEHLDGSVPSDGPLSTPPAVRPPGDRSSAPCPLNPPARW